MTRSTYMLWLPCLPSCLLLHAPAQHPPCLPLSPAHQAGCLPACLPACLTAELSRCRLRPLRASLSVGSALVDLSSQPLNLRLALLQFLKSFGKPRAVVHPTLGPSSSPMPSADPLSSSSASHSATVVHPDTRSLVHPRAVVNPITSPYARSLAQLLAVLCEYSVAWSVA